VDDRWEWNPALLAVREILEGRLEHGLAKAVPRPPFTPPAQMRQVLADLVAADDGPSLARFLQKEADLGQFREFVMHRSIYHLKEADPHTWAIPRLRGSAKAALVEIQADEYGGGRVERMHSELFRATMRGLDLDDSYGAYRGGGPFLRRARAGRRRPRADRRQRHVWRIDGRAAVAGRGHPVRRRLLTGP
jgi:hypothetical protein